MVCDYYNKLNNENINTVKLENFPGISNRIEPNRTEPNRTEPNSIELVRISSIEPNSKKHRNIEKVQ